MLALDPNAKVSSSTEVNTGVIEIPPTQPAGFDFALWQLLQDVKAAGIPLRGKIAEYAGFYNQIGATITTEWDPTTDNGVKPDQPQTGTDQPNKSLDKLTFLIMFRLPFRGEVVEVTPPLTDPEIDLCNNRKIFKKTDGTYVLGAFHEVRNSEAEITSVDFQLCTVARPNPIANFEIDGKDLFYDVPTGSFYVYGPYVSNFGDPLAPAGMTWSKRANDLRAAAGLRRLNGAGEQVALVGGLYRHVDDAGNIVSFDYNTPETPNAYAYYGVDFADLFPGLPSPESITSQSTIDFIKTLPLYYFLTVYTENKPQKFNRTAHYPEKLKKKVLARRPITFGTYTAAGVFTASSPQPAAAGIALQIVQLEAATGRYYVKTNGTGAVNYLTEDFSGDEDFTADSFYISGASPGGLTVVNEGQKFYVENPNRLSQATTKWNSGLTLGSGYDIGGNYEDAYVYKIVFKIQKQTGATGSFTLHYESRESSISFATTEANLRQELSTLMGIDEDLIAVKSATASLTVGYSGWDVTIQRGVGQSVGGYRNVYSHELFYHKPAAENPARVFITPATDSQRYVERTAAELPAVNYSDFEARLNGYYASSDFTAPDPVQDGSHLTGFNASQFKAAVKKIFGLSGGPAAVMYNRYKTVFDVFQMPRAERTMLQNYLLLFSTNYYTSNLVANKIGGIVAPGAAPNVLEKVLFATISYGGIGRWQAHEYQMNNITLKPEKEKGENKIVKRNDPGIILAISSHNQYELKNLFRHRNPRLEARRNFLIGYVEKFQHILNRGVEE